MWTNTGTAVLWPFLVSAQLALASFPRAQNVTWKSTNFKTILTWGPAPTAQFSYTVEFSQMGKDQQRNPHCIRTSQTQCDLSSSMTDLSACYTAYVLSEPPQGVPAEPIEYPFTSAPKFCPYQDTLILSPSFKLEAGPDQRTTTLHITDPLTAAFSEGRQLTIRDVFRDQLEYKVTYRRNQSTGKKEVTSRSNVVEVTGLDRGQSYCFQVQALVRSRPPQSQLGELSQTLCTTQTNPSPLDKYSVIVIAGAVLLPLLLLGGLIAVVVMCCRRKKKEKHQDINKNKDII